VSLDTSSTAARLDPWTSALLVVDVQNDNSTRSGLRAAHGQDVQRIETCVVPRLADLIAAARRAGVLVVYTRNTQRVAGLGASPERTARWRAWAGVAADAYSLEGTWGHAVVDDLRPQPTDLVIDKDRASAFHATPLDLILRARDVSTVVVTGVATEACVEATAMHASWLDYAPVVVADCVGSHTTTYHEAALSLMRRRHVVLDSASVIATWATTCE
jgi:nicotinamidase-related amidase